jgi:hypothetical protein
MSGLAAGGTGSRLAWAEDETGMFEASIASMGVVAT